MDIGKESLKIMAKASWYNLWLYSFVKPYLGNKVLELGSGIGTITELLVGTKRYVTATDIKSIYLKDLKSRFKNKKVRVVKVDLEKDGNNLKEAAFDTAVCLNVLEHIKNDQIALKTISQSLVNGGKLLLLVPAHPVLYGSLDINLEHKRRYSKTEIETKLESAGFSIEEIRYLNFFGTFGWFVNSKVLNRKIVSEFQVVMFDKLARLFLEVEKVIKPPFGLSLFVVAKK